MTKHVKISRGNITYFIRNEIYSQLAATVAVGINCLELVQLSDYVVDTGNNMLLKCPDSVETIVDNWANNH